MIEILPESQDNMVCLRAVGKLTDAEYQKLIPELESFLEKHGTARIYCDITEMEGWELAAAWDDFAFGVKHWNDFTKLALLGNQRWEELSVKIGDKLTKADVRYFPEEEKEAALAWISAA